MITWLLVNYFSQIFLQTGLTLIALAYYSCILYLAVFDVQKSFLSGLFETDFDFCPEGFK